MRGIPLFGAAAMGVALMLQGCAQAPAVPQGYAGPIAVVKDSAAPESSSRAVFFFLSQVNGRSIQNSLGATRVANQGRGFSLTPTVLSREVPAQTVQIKLEGQVAYGAPIEAIVNAGTVYSVSRVVDVTLQPNHSYEVKGILSASQKAVWLEDTATGEVLGGGKP